MNRLLSIAAFLMMSLIFCSCGSTSATNMAYPTDYTQTPYETMDSEPIYEMNTDEFSVIVERGFVSPLSQPLSTFSANVNTASYSFIRRTINTGGTVNVDSVKIEEMINYFKYDYPAQQNGHPISIYTELHTCPWNEDNLLVQIAVAAESIDRSEFPRSNLVFLIDVSGSMDSPDKLPLIQSAFSLLTKQFTENDRISIVVYAGDERVLIDGESGESQAKILKAINDLTAGGSTGGSKGITTAYDIARNNYIEGGINRVILATDGDFNVGITSEGELKRLIETQRDSGIFLSVLGVGTGNLKDNKMETLSKYGNGNYSYIDSIDEAKRVLVSEMGGTLFTVAKDVKLQAEFNPAVVESYRLIGYENRMLNAEDFKDDSKQGGDMGSGHIVIALYEISLRKDGEAESDLKYQQNVIVGNSDEILTVKVRYKQPESNESIELEHIVNQEDTVLSNNFILASSVAEFGLLLRDSEYKGQASYRAVKER